MDNELPIQSSSDQCFDTIDWINVWKERKLRQLATPHYLNSIDFWSDEENVRRLYLYDKKGRATLVMEQLGGIKIYPGAKVLDIGAGPGTLAVPLARRGCKVTAVEPSGVMVSALRDYQASEQVDDIRIIEKKWEDVTIEEWGGRLILSLRHIHSRWWISERQSVKWIPYVQVRPTCSGS